MSEPARSRRLFSIGEVLARLQPEFPDLSHSKVRFLESSGLIEPQRTASGYRKFTDADVERIQTILRLQRDHYMPHKAIKDYLDATERGLQPHPVAHDVPVAPTPISSDVDVSAFAPSNRAARLKPAELAASAGIDLKMVQNLESFGLIKLSSAGYFGTDDVEVATLAGRLATFGIEPRHLRLFRTAADREVSLIEAVTTPLRRHRGADSPAKAEEVSREIASVGLQLHIALVRGALSELGTTR